MKPRFPRTVVVTGLGVVSPIGVGVPSFLDGLKSGASGTRAITRFDASGFPCRVAADVTVPEEDLRYPIDGKDLRIAARVSRLALAAGLEAFEDAGIEWAGLDLEARRRLGVWVGTGGGGIAWGEQQYEIYFRDGWQKTSVFGVVSGLPGMISSDLSTAFGAHGPSHVLSTGCTSSSDAIGYAAGAIASGAIDRALAGGTEAPLAAGIFSNFCRMKAMPTIWNETPGRASRPFDLQRDGFVLGEGAYFVLLEEQESARRRGAVPYATLAGYSSTCDAFHRTRNHPSGEETARAIEQALGDSGLSAADVGYVNLHGTGTPLNDRIETLAMKRVFGERAPGIPMSSVKSQVGHPQGAAGAAGLLATLLAIRHEFLPPTINREVPDPDCDLDYVPGTARSGRFDAAVVNCISFGSKNSALVVRR
jgi:3-oxoacyl-[acyl-carrier-protein] synthase II